MKPETGKMKNEKIMKELEKLLLNNNIYVAELANLEDSLGAFIKDQDKETFIRNITKKLEDTNFKTAISSLVAIFSIMNRKKMYEIEGFSENIIIDKLPRDERSSDGELLSENLRLGFLFGKKRGNLLTTAKQTFKNISSNKKVSVEDVKTLYFVCLLAFAYSCDPNGFLNDDEDPYSDGDPRSNPSPDDDDKY